MAKTRGVHLMVITPERQVLDENCTEVVIPAHDGELGILPGRAPLMCELGIGQLRYRRNGDVRRAFIDGGFAQVYENRVTVLTNRSLPADEVTPEVVATAEQAVRQIAGTDTAAMSAREIAKRRLRALRSVRPASGFDSGR